MTPRLKRRHLLAAASLAAPALLASRAAAAQPAPLSIALSPFLSPAALLTAFRPLREHLERQLARPVEMLTARDFRSLCEMVRAQRQDVAMLPAHLARLATLEWEHRPLVTTLESFHALVLVRQDSPVRTPAELRGATIGMLDALSLTATVGQLWLREQGLADSVTVRAVPSVNSALFALDRGELGAVIAGDSQLAVVPAGTPRSERVLATLRDVPGPIYVARNRLPAADFEALRAAMLAFTPDPSRPATASNSRLRPVEPALLARLDPLAAIARRALAGG